MATQTARTQTESSECLATCENSQGVPLQATISRLSRHEAVFEVYTPFEVLRVSEALSNFRILLNDRLIYSGRAVVSNLVNAGNVVVCQANLEDGWLDVDLAASGNGAPNLALDFEQFMRTSQSAFKILPEFKLVIADMQIFLLDLRSWMDQIELGVRSQPSGSRQEFERELISQLQEPVLPMLGMLFEKFEESCRRITPELQPAHRSYVKRQLHPIVLCAPFMYRTFRKPLGYAGDYEMVNMMVRDPLEGASVFAKVLNAFFLSTPPVAAHRNRLLYLKGMLVREVARASQHGRSARIFNLGCGPAKEVQDFVSTSDLSNRAHFTLLDFNEETLEYTGRVLADTIRQHHRSTGIQLVKKSVAQLIKEAAKPHSSLLGANYDLVYCAGLLDYMPDSIAQQLMTIFDRMLAPDGLLVVTNVDECNPSRNWMEYSVDWHLIYRDYRKMAKLIPAFAAPDSARIISEDSGVNTILELREPKHG